MKKRYLALGDSYTIGEQVARADSFPFQVVRLFQQQRLQFGEPQVIAQTGWTTTDLVAAVEREAPAGPFDLVTLLIGVNNQYRGWPINGYQPAFEQLLIRAIHLAGGKQRQVIVLSIPDWGVTPFAADRNRRAIAADIDNYNQVNKDLAARYETGYIGITAGTREAAFNPGLLAPDGLHPSGQEYARWAEKIVNYWFTLSRSV